MKNRTFNVPDSLSVAIKKGAHRTEKSQRRFVIDALIKELSALKDSSIDTLVTDTEANLEAEDEARLASERRYDAQ
jgi:hypothetical protein